MNVADAIVALAARWPEGRWSRMHDRREVDITGVVDGVTVALTPLRRYRRWHAERMGPAGAHAAVMKRNPVTAVEALFPPILPPVPVAPRSTP